MYFYVEESNEKKNIIINNIIINLFLCLVCGSFKNLKTFLIYFTEKNIKYIYIYLSIYLQTIFKQFKF